MKQIFIDTSSLVALFDMRDKNHQKAIEVFEAIKKKECKLLMSDYIFDETITTVLSNTNHKIAVKVGDFILNSANVEIVWLNIDLKMKAWEYFKRHTDKVYSFTDCTSFILMLERNTHYYFAFDEDFQRAGFIDFYEISKFLYI
ncbi:PilT protein [Candidatus Magnetoovum chiemensis]|nr:PilT protein [Candidatus Magnetoovum chiemensis]